MEEKRDDHRLQWNVAAKFKVLADMTLELKQSGYQSKKKCFFFEKKAKS